MKYLKNLLNICSNDNFALIAKNYKEEKEATTFLIQLLSSLEIYST